MIDQDGKDYNGLQFTDVKINAKLFNVSKLMPRSHQSLNMFKRCLVKHDLKLFSL